MFTPARLFLNKASVLKIKNFIKNNGIYKINFVQKVWHHSESRTFTNWMKATTSIPLRDLLTLCTYMNNISIEQLTGEIFDDTYLSHQDSKRIKRFFNDGEYKYQLVAQALNMDIATLKNWVYRYSSINQQQYQYLLNELGLTPLPLDRIQEQTIETSKTSTLEQQYQTTQKLRSLLLQNNALLSGDFRNIPQHIVDTFLEQANTPEKNVIFFHHNAKKQKDFYAVIRVYGKPTHCILTFIHNSRVRDYGDVSIGTGIKNNYVIAKNLFAPDAVQIAQPNDDVIKIATWFGSESCLFAIRSAETFRIEVDSESELSEQDVIADPDMVIFFR